VTMTQPAPRPTTAGGGAQRPEHQDTQRGAAPIVPPPREQGDGQQQRQQQQQLQSRSSFPAVDPAFVEKVLAFRACAPGTASARVIWQARKYVKFPEALADHTVVRDQELHDCFFELDSYNYIDCRIYFDTASDKMVIENSGSKPVFITQDGVTLRLTVQQSLVASGNTFRLHSLGSDSNITIAIAFVILPKTFHKSTFKVAIRGAPEDQHQHQHQPLKRRLPLSDASEHDAKRGRLADGAPVKILPPIQIPSSAVVAAASASPPAAAASPPAAVAPVVGRQVTYTIINPNHSHALTRECCYSLSQVKSFRPNDSVIIGRHSGLVRARHRQVVSQISIGQDLGGRKELAGRISRIPCAMSSGSYNHIIVIIIIIVIVVVIIYRDQLAN
jgi:hypothetical protein